MPTTSAKLTDGMLKRAGPGVYRDTQESSLICRISASGRKVWLADVHVQGRHTRRRLGLFQAAATPRGAAPVRISTAEAREMVRVAVGRLQAGEADAAPAPPIPTLAEWFDDHERRSKNELETLLYHRHRFKTYVATCKVELGGLRASLATVPLDRLEGYHLDDLRDHILAKFAEASPAAPAPAAGESRPEGTLVPAPRRRRPVAPGARTANLTLARINTILIDAEKRRRVPPGWQRPRPSELAQEAGQDATNHVRLHQAIAFYAAVEQLRQRAGYKVGNNSTIADMILTLLWTGGRVGNVASMTWEELDLEGGVWMIPRAKYKTRRKMRETHKLVPLEGHVLQLLRARHSARRSGWVFPRSEDPTQHIGEIRRSLDWVLERAGITQRVTIHGLRHSLGTWLHQSGANLKTIAAQLGQADLASTERYAHDEAAFVRDLTGKAIAASYTVVESASPDQVAVRMTREQWAQVLDLVKGTPLEGAVAAAAGGRPQLALPAGAGAGPVVASNQ